MLPGSLAERHEAHQRPGHYFMRLCDDVHVMIDDDFREPGDYPSPVTIGGPG